MARNPPLPLRSCQQPLRALDGLPSRVSRSMSVVVVQSLVALPSTMHPGDKLQGSDIERMADALYIPVFDVDSGTSSSPLAVLEIFLTACPHEGGGSPLLSAADVISVVSGALVTVGLSVSTPLASMTPPLPPVRLSKAMPSELQKPTTLGPPPLSTWPSVSKDDILHESSFPSNCASSFTVGDHGAFPTDSSNLRKEEEEKKEQLPDNDAVAAGRMGAKQPRRIGVVEGTSSCSDVAVATGVERATRPRGDDDDDDGFRQVRKLRRHSTARGSVRDLGSLITSQL